MIDDSPNAPRAGKRFRSLEGFLLAAINRLAGSHAAVAQTHIAG
jgi:hypothetical protein